MARRPQAESLQSILPREKIVPSTPSALSWRMARAEVGPNLVAENASNADVELTAVMRGKANGGGRLGDSDSGLGKRRRRRRERFKVPGVRRRIVGHGLHLEVHQVAEHLEVCSTHFRQQKTLE
jgi:hypothetical protein